MRSTAITLLVLSVGVSLAVCSGPAFALTETWTGTVSWDKTVVATPDWNTSGTALTWTVTWYDFNEAAWAGWYKYEYAWSNGAGGSISHLIIEVSDGRTGELPAFSAGNSKDLSGLVYNGDPNDPPEEVLSGYYSSANGNPNIPEQFYGLKIGTDDEGSSESVYFYSRRVPVWGDFYAKDGENAAGDGTSTAWNTGFTSPDSDPSTALYPIKTIVDEKYNANDTTYWGHIAVPDSKYATPEPAAWILLLSASAVSAFIRRRRS